MAEELYELHHDTIITKEGHQMFYSDIVKDLNYWRNEALRLNRILLKINALEAYGKKCYDQALEDVKEKMIKEYKNGGFLCCCAECRKRFLDQLKREPKE